MCSQVQRQITRTILPLMFFAQIQKPFLLICGFISLFTISAKISYNSSFIVRFVKYLNKLFFILPPPTIFIYFFATTVEKSRQCHSRRTKCTVGDTPIGSRDTNAHKINIRSFAELFWSHVDKKGEVWYERLHNKEKKWLRWPLICMFTVQRFWQSFFFF